MTEITKYVLVYMNYTFTKYEVQGGSLHCFKYPVRTSEAAGFLLNMKRLLSADFVRDNVFMALYF